MDSTARGRRVVVIGGGITELTAAYRLTQCKLGSGDGLIPSPVIWAAMIRCDVKLFMTVAF